MSGKQQQEKERWSESKQIHVLTLDEIAIEPLAWKRLETPSQEFVHCSRELFLIESRIREIEATRQKDLLNETRQ